MINKEKNNIIKFLEVAITKKFEAVGKTASWEWVGGSPFRLFRSKECYIQTTPRVEEISEIYLVKNISDSLDPIYLEKIGVICPSCQKVGYIKKPDIKLNLVSISEIGSLEIIKNGGLK